MSKLRPEDAERRRLAGHGPDHSEALARGLQILMTFNEARPSQTLSGLAELVELPRATVRRVLLTLVTLGYVQLDGRHFRLTSRVLRLATAYLTSNTVSTLLQPACDRIARAIGASCTAAVLEGDEVVMIARALPAQLIPAGVGVGYRLPAYCSALGRVLLAGLPDAAVTAYLGRTDLTAITPHTLTDPAAIRAAIQTVREQGHCFVDQEAEYGFRSIAVPLRKFDGALIAALNIGVPVEPGAAPDFNHRFLAILTEKASDLTGYLI